MLKKLLLLLLLLLLITPTVFALEGKVYENKYHKYRLTYPQNWISINVLNKTNDGIALSFVSPDLAASVSVEVRKSPIKNIEKLSAEDVRKAVEETINEASTLVPGLKLNSYSVENFKNQKAIKFCTSTSSPESTDTTYLFFYNSCKYEISFGGFIPEMDKYRNILIESINSFEFSQ